MMLQLAYKYANTLRVRNHGTMYVMSCIMIVPNANSYLKKLFLSFPELKYDFLIDCRPFIGLDVCHLRGIFGGLLLTLVSLDVNSGLFQWK